MDTMGRPGRRVLNFMFSPEMPGFVRQDWRLNKYNDDDSDEY
ncbi:hypothetical protein EC036_19560 [Enterobacter cloacae]|nr:hypothetical protein EC036_19560 [Enterobacter cloacae]